MNRRMMYVVLFVAGTIAIALVMRKQIRRGVSYHKNGQLRHQVILKNGKPEGLGINYYADGSILSKTQWRDGRKHGLNTFYYDDGTIRQMNQFRNGLCTISKDFDEEGRVEQITIYDSLGRIFDYSRFRTDGSRDYRQEMKRAIFLPEHDTVSKGDFYVTAIRLGNRQFDHIRVIIGDWADPEIALRNSPLPMKDSLTALARILAGSVGIGSVSGIIIERSLVSDSFSIVPFTHRFFVKDGAG